MIKQTLLLACLMVIYVVVVAQQKPINFQVKDNRGGAVDGATIELLSAADSTLIKAGITDSSGNCIINGIAGLPVLARVTALNTIEKILPITEVPNGVIVIELKRSDAVMQEVTLLAKKPFVQKLHDRLVVNVAGSIVASGSSALDVLERSPGVLLDANDNISLRGRQGVLVMVDGKPLNLASADLVAYLRGLPSSMIDRIDLITNPPARYDAAGSSVIDIRLKKDQRLGANGTFTAGYGQGVYPKANAGLSFNYRTKRINLYGNYNYNFRKGLNHLFVHWDFFENGNITGGYDQDFFGKFPINTHNARLGVDFFLSKKTTAGLLFSGNDNRYTRINDNKTTALTPQNEADYISLTRVGGKNKLINGIYTFNIRHAFDSSGREWTLDADYGTYDNFAFTEFTSRYFSPDGNKIRPNYVQSSDQQGVLTIRTARTDYVHPLKKNIRLEAGFKTSYVSADNDLRFFDLSSGTSLPDERRTNRFFYDEYINAGYFNLRKEFKKWDLQIGLRGENTKIFGRQQVNDVRFDSAYLQFFPSAFVNYRPADDRAWGISLSRRIFRPDYSSLNPFIFFVDPSLYTTGNPSLKPEFTWLFEGSYSKKGMVFTIGYGLTKNVINVIVNQADTNKMVSVQQILNLNSSAIYNVQAVVPFTLMKGWQVNTTTEFLYADFEGTVSNTTLTNGGFSVSTDISNQFILGKGWSAEFSGRYRSRTREAFMIIRPQWGINAGVQKQIMKSKGTLRFNVTDIFWTNLPRASTHYVASREHWHAYRETRVLNFNFTYRFGNSKLQPQRRRSEASEEERRRAGG